MPQHGLRTFGKPWSEDNVVKISLRFISARQRIKARNIRTTKTLYLRKDEPHPM